SHGTEVRVDIEVFVVQRAGGLAVEGDFELLGPIQGGPRLAHVVIPLPRAGDAAGDVAGVGGDFVYDAALLDVVRLGQADVLLGGDVTQHRRAGPGGFGRADAARDVVV